MHRRGVFAFPIALAVSFAAQTLRANPANGDPRKEKLFSSFIAPCCWRENLLVHQSPKADELRAEIEKLVAAGKSDDDIRKTLVDQYSTRILALPEGVLGDWLSWTPIAATAFGLTAVALFIRRSIRLKPAQPPGDAPTPLDIEDFEEYPEPQAPDSNPKP